MDANAAADANERQVQVAALVRAKVAPEQQATIEELVDRYFGQVDPEDLAERQPADLYGAALSHWNFARKREPGRPKVRVFNPTIEEHGWQSTHTIIEIVNDDMPFLVDSVTMEVNRHGLTLHLIIHPVLAVVRDATATLEGLAPESEDGAPRIVHPRRSRPHYRSRASRCARRRRRARAGRRSRGGRRLEARCADACCSIVTDLDERPPPIAAEELAEGKAFLRWLADNHFTMLGYRCHELVTVDGQDALRIVPGSSLGILRETGAKDVAASFAALPPEERAYARGPSS